MNLEEFCDGLASTAGFLPNVGGSASLGLVLLGLTAFLVGAMIVLRRQGRRGLAAMFAAGALLVGGAFAVQPVG